MSNKERHPEAWDFFAEQARNITQEIELSDLGNYRIPKPNKSGDFLYADKVEELWCMFILQWYKEDVNSESVRGRMQYIVNNF